jgi:membrane protein DedA with SNARE-associated domain
MQDWLISALSRHGYLGLGFLMFLQNVVPILPSEIIMPLAGFLASLGYLELHEVVMAGLAGSLLGHLPWYFLGHRLGEERLEGWLARYGRWIRVYRADIRKADGWFARHAGKAVFLGRLVPGLRTYINIPAGATRMAFLPFFLFTLIGDALWNTLLAFGGYALGGDYPLIAAYLHVFLWVSAAAVALWLLRRRYKGRRIA